MSTMLAAPRNIESIDDCFFYHTMDLPGLGLIHAHWDLRGKFDDYVGGVDVAGKSVLDVGTATGFLSFEAEKRGAPRVLSFDLEDARQVARLPFKDNLFYKDHESWLKTGDEEIERWKNAYWLCHRLLGSHAEVFYGDIYNLPTALGAFDVVIVGSVLEHLNDQIMAMASIARLTKHTMIIVTPLIQTDDPIARFQPQASNPTYDFTWWNYSTGVYREVLKMLGFTIQSITTAAYYYDYGDRFEERSTIVAVRDAGV